MELLAATVACSTIIIATQLFSVSLVAKRRVGRVGWFQALPSVQMFVMLGGLILVIFLVALDFLFWKYQGFLKKKKKKKTTFNNQQKTLSNLKEIGFC